MSDDILTSETAKILDVSPDRVRQLERAGVLHARRVGGVRVFSRAHVEQVRDARAARRQERAA